MRVKTGEQFSSLELLFLVQKTQKRGPKEFKYKVNLIANF